MLIIKQPARRSNCVTNIYSTIFDIPALCNCQEWSLHDDSSSSSSSIEKTSSVDRVGSGS